MASGSSRDMLVNIFVSSTIVGSSRDMLMNIFASSTIVGSHSLHFSMLSDRKSASAAELTFPLT